ncbi:MAG: antibiotic biosynthesis monooxygenase [Gemmatimonadetes bacterium]|jgi:quinol monooxygenase YgiN|nr:antibiotic biosynthesis monooxygenase [Gemmatimonadota bacterium]
MDYRFLRFHVNRGCEEKFKEAFIQVLTHTREEEGCVYINGYQDQQDPGTFRIQSCWENQQAFDAHITTPHVKQFGNLTKDMKDEPGEMYITDRVI